MILVGAVVTAVLMAGCASSPTPQADTSGLVWPAPPEDPRVRFVAQYHSQKDLSGTDFKAKLLGTADQVPGLRKPYGVTASPDGKRIYVTDTELRALMVFDLEAKKLQRFKTDARGGLISPIEVRTDSRGRVYVTDSVHAKLNVYSPEGRTLLSLGGSGQLQRPTGLALDETRERIYVSDTKRHRIVVYDFNGEWVREIGERGDAPGRFNYPVNLAVDNEGNLYVVDTGNFRVQVFGPDGEYQRDFGQLGDSVGSMARPKGVGLDSKGHVYLADAAFNNFQIFDSDGKILLFVGGTGRGPGQFWRPTGIYIDSNDRIYVVDSANARLQIFQYLGDKERGRDEPSADKNKETT
ncbi:6-bladed beta-propeller [Thiohalomonas denitrificans]|uniref:6-bladed beta-propeller n=1 Tax=Thiohalomonas denitrificans TaxID=415747 RepID=UPI0026F27C8D|nr:6-bladed beta-propeller [Thiohalomonas denitrificans]